MHHYRARAAQAVRERLLHPLRQLNRGEVAVALAIGVLGGIFPVPLVTSLMTLLLGWLLHCSTPQYVLGSTANLFCTPLQVALLPSLARLSGTLARVDTSAFTAHALREAMSKGTVAFLASGGRMIAYAVLAWFVLFTPIVVALRVVQKLVAPHGGAKDRWKLVNVEETRV